MPLGAVVPLGQELRLQVRHHIAVLGMNERDRPDLGTTPERGEHLVIVHHERALVGHEMLERVDAAAHHLGHLVKDLLAPPGDRHVKRVVAVRPRRLVVPHLDRVQEPLPGEGSAKSTTMVVPPDSAARVPLSKSSEE